MADSAETRGSRMCLHNIWALQNQDGTPDMFLLLNPATALDILQSFAS